LLFYNVEITNDFDIKKRYSGYFFSIPILGQIFKKIYFFGFLIIIFLSFEKKEKFIYFSLIFIYLLNSILNASRYELGLVSIALLIFFRNNYRFFLIIFLAPLLIKVATVFRELYNFHRLIDVSNFNFNTSILFFKKYFENLNFITQNGRNVFLEILITYYERLIFLDEYLRTFFSSLRSDDIKYLLNFFQIIPSFIRKRFVDIEILPYTNEETRAIGLHSNTDSISTVSFGHIAESIYVLDHLFFLTPIVLGIIIYYFNKIIKNINYNFYIAFSISFTLLLVMKESLTAISLDIIMVFLLTFLLKKYFLNYKS